ncbi:hypothetical protein RJT34_32049 [Clitoria ternatea]|uniref:Uncharacterized protein n=1 Tax=Clitoria ternatea TaxID=43366 RepID=A0AAN9EXI1_CLITE
MKLPTLASSGILGVPFVILLSRAGFFSFSSPLSLAFHYKPVTILILFQIRKGTYPLPRIHFGTVANQMAITATLTTNDVKTFISHRIAGSLQNNLPYHGSVKFNSTQTLAYLPHFTLMALVSTH